VPPKDATEERVHATAWFVDLGDLRMSDQSASLLENEWGIHGEQGLLRDARTRPPLDALVRDRKVEGAEHGWQILAINQGVNGAPGVKRFVRQIHWAAAHRQVKTPGKEQQRVSHGFKIESASRKMTE
jgi:hypothetical protein